MKIQSLISLAMVASLVTACSDDMEQTFNSTEGVLNATVEGNSPGSRVSFSQQGTFSWSEGDKIGVTTSTIQNSFTSLTLNSGAGTGSGSFSGLIAEGSQIQGYAVYPFYEQHSINSNTLSYYFPAFYDYDKVDEDYSALNGNSFNTAMCGMIQNGNVLMKHLGGVFCIKIEKMPVTKGKLEFTTDKVITGSFNADLNNTDLFLESTETSTDPNKNTVTIKFNSVTNNKGVFYIPVPTGTYNNVRIKVFDEYNSEKINVVTGTNYSITRALAKKLILTDGGVDATIPTKAASLSDAEGELKNSKAVSVSGEITSSGTNSISIPAVTATDDENTSKSLMLESVGSGATLTVNDASSSQSEKPVDNFTLSIPNNETENFDALDVTVNMPNTTVTLAGNGGAAKYGTVTASTAANTLIISSGVEIANVIIKKGNIRVNKGAKLTSIEKSSDNTASTVTIYKEEGATLPESLNNKTFIVIDAAVADMQNVAKNGGEYTLPADITLTSPLVVEKEMTLDLNGFALKASNTDYTAVKDLVGSNQGVVLVRRGGNLTVKDSNGNGSIDYNQNNSVYSAIILTNKADETDETLKNQPAKLTVDGGHLKGFNFGICGNGNRHNTEITINGGIVESHTGVYHPQYGTMTVNGGEIKGVNAAVELRSGTINVNGGKLVATAAEFSEEPNGSGTTMIGVALAVSQHSTDKDISVNITDGEFIGVKALYEKDLQNKISDNITLKIEDGTFNGGVYSKNRHDFVTGGTFSDPNVLHYLGSNANVTLDKSETAMKLSESAVVANKNITINLNDNTLTSAGKEAFVVNEGASVIIKNGQIGTSEPNDKLMYGVHAQKSTNVTLTNVVFSEMVMYAYNGNGGELTATGCKFQGWLSGWHDGGTFNNCTFTKGKAYYPAAICYGNTTFEKCKFYKNGTDPDSYDKIAGTTSWNSKDGSSNGYFDCNYVVSAKKDKSVTMNSCTFFNESENSSTGNVSSTDHPYLTGWGDAGTWAQQLTIDSQSVQITTAGSDSASQQ